MSRRIYIAASEGGSGGNVYDNVDDDERYHFRLDDRYEDGDSSDEDVFRCVCAWGNCSGDCGTLPCGCIDTCRGRCEARALARVD